MKKIEFDPNDTKKNLVEKCKDGGITLTGLEKKGDVILLLENHNDAIDDLVKEREKIVGISKKVEEVIPPSKFYTTLQYLNLKKVSSRIRFFIVKKYGETLETERRWDEIFRSEGL